ncbi:hypothetical protein [uncultured Alistipes sp.]|uniref:hypothetical protein n=1 Tax=uncultured Alistipes sp. TaxID=538949 RepID=UPI00272A53AD|nr:hypothetical protein [uncultured Alistipes sp.]
MPDQFEPGQGIRYQLKSINPRVPSDNYGLIIGAQGDDVQIVSVHRRKRGTRFYDESDDSRDSFKDNILLECDELYSEFREHAYNNDCYAVADMSRVITVYKGDSEILDGGEKIPEENLALILDHLHRSQRQRDLYQEDVRDARREAETAPARRVLGGNRPSDDVPEPEADLEAVEVLNRRRDTAVQLEGIARRQARRGAGPEQARAEPAAAEPSTESRLAALTSGIKPPNTGHGGLGE